MVSKPVVLLITSDVREVDPEQWARINAEFEILNYDCKDIAEFCTRLAPGGIYSRIQAIVRTGWLKSGPFGNQFLFRGIPLKYFPPTLKLIACGGHGYDAVDVDKLTEMGIWYCNAPNTCTEAVANTALHLILSTFRYFTFAEHCARNDQWDKSKQLGKTALDPSNKVLGIVGMGTIGQSIAVRAAAGLGMNIHYFNRRQLVETESKITGGAVYHSSLESLLKMTDCLCLACPYTPETHHMISGPQFAMAKPSGLRIVNIARGGLIDEAALLEAMNQGKVVGVGLDVHENEPGINPELRDNYMITVLPHIGVCSRTSWLGFDRVCFENLEEFFYGGNGKPVTPVNEIL